MLAVSPQNLAISQLYHVASGIATLLNDLLVSTFLTLCLVQSFWCWLGVLVAPLHVCRNNAFAIFDCQGIIVLCQPI